MHSTVSRKEPTLRLSLEEYGDISIREKEEIPELELLREYRRVQITLGHPPTSAEITKLSKYHACTYARRFGSWSSFRASMGNPVEYPLTRQQLIENYFSVKELLGRVPTGTELGIYGNYGVRTYHKYFGGHRKLLESLGECEPADTKGINTNAGSEDKTPKSA